MAEMKLNETHYFSDKYYHKVKNPKDHEVKVKVKWGTNILQIPKTHICMLGPEIHYKSGKINKQISDEIPQIYLN